MEIKLVYVFSTSSKCVQRLASHRVKDLSIPITSDVSTSLTKYLEQTVPLITLIIYYHSQLLLSTTVPPYFKQKMAHIRSLLC